MYVFIFLQCEPFAIINSVGQCSSIGLTQRCCKWDPMDGQLKSECCPSGICQPDGEGDEFDVATCELPEVVFTNV